ncbi:hypothetical protein MUK42_02792 [Musa troglodytarum]|uniref:Uncharacterized protein n=1 Tax=Musa troglodytarum TaxID=320322 RepID=A0A9E7ENK9_9LILI|nr:hypothetical protein MUK42_02792 [Musa troglodytarum]
MGGAAGGSSVPAMALSYFGFRNNKEGGVQQETESVRKTMGKRGEEEEEEGKARKSWAARFAVELDGLHCFETLIAHH